jgi:hypothetical protein
MTTSLFCIFQHCADTQPVAALPAQRRMSCPMNRCCCRHPSNVATHCSAASSVFCPAAHQVTVADGVVWAITADRTFTVMRQDISMIANPYSAFIADKRAEHHEPGLRICPSGRCRQSFRDTAWFAIQDADPGLARVVTVSATRPDVNHKDRTTILAITLGVCRVSGGPLGVAHSAELPRPVILH